MHEKRFKGVKNMRQFDTSIKKIMDAKTYYNSTHYEKAIFLSNWDVSIDTSPYALLLNNNLSEYISETNSYYYWTDEYNYTTYFKDYFEKKYDYTIDLNSFLIGANGTSAIFLSLAALKELSISRILIFTPIYFSTLNLLEMLNFQVFRFDLKIENDFKVDFEQLEFYIKNNKIEAIFITDPVFGSGIEYDISFYTTLSTLIMKYDFWTIVDYVYGGMIWNNNEHIFNKKLVHIIKNLKNTILIESISKRLFINGIKFALVFGSETIIKKIKRLSIYTTGSMCVNQLLILKKVYDTNNVKIINQLIEKNTEHAQNMFYKLLSFLMGKNCIISKCNSSFFFLLGIPKKEKDDLQDAFRLINYKGVLTIPHSRYLLENDDYYIFRVNLLMNEELLFCGLHKVLEN